LGGIIAAGADGTQDFSHLIKEMRMTFARTVFAAAALALACGAGYAADADKDRENKAHKGFNDMDKNADGKLTRAEAAGNKDLLAKWKNADSNNDGVLTRAEYLKVMAVKDFNTVKEKVTGDDKKAKSDKTARNDKEHQGFNEMDRNNDGKLTRSEATGNKEVLAKWKEADKDNDGVLTRTEYLTVMAKKDANTAKQAVNKQVDEAKRRAPDASTGSTSEGKSK
jgi:Ca2+-binding EF-hand superfamily protein